MKYKMYENTTRGIKYWDLIAYLNFLPRISFSDGGQGPAPGYLASLNNDSQEELKTNIHKKLPFESDGSIKLLARAIAVRGIYNL